MTGSSVESLRAGELLQLSLAGFLIFLLGSQVLVATYTVVPRVGSALYYAGPVCLAANILALIGGIGFLAAAGVVGARRLLKRSAT
ncbi:hypothetical protein D3C71_301310 [compost metagenome]|jgi:hypothetical protein